MGEQERLRSKVMEMVRQKTIPLRAAAEMVRVSYRQAKRLKAAYLKHGDAGLVHGNCGRVSNNRTSEAVVAQAVALYLEKYHDFGPTFAAEKLGETDGIQMSVSTLRRKLIGSGEWQGKKRNAVYRSRRECFGELVQFAGSHHKWFEERGRKCCLITMIDDATNIRLSRFYEEETIAGVMEVFSLWIKSYGIPQALYCDHKNAFILTREPSDAELLRGITEVKSHFGRACEKLGVEVIGAYSPQAKGRVERNHSADQDRLVKELRLLGISDIETANRFLKETYLPKMNKKFSRPASREEDAHVPLGEVSLYPIMCREFERTVANNYTIRYENRLFQILKRKGGILPRPKDKVTVRITLDGKMTIVWKEKELLVKELTNTIDHKVRGAA